MEQQNEQQNENGQETPSKKSARTGKGPKRVRLKSRAVRKADGTLIIRPMSERERKGQSMINGVAADKRRERRARNEEYRDFIEQHRDDLIIPETDEPWQRLVKRQEQQEQADQADEDDGQDA